MKYSTLATVLCLAQVSLGHLTRGFPPYEEACVGSASPPDHIIERSAELAALEAAESKLIRKRTQRKPIKVKTYFHVLAENKTLAGGWIPKIHLEKQFQVMNKAFAPSNIVFELKDTDYNFYNNWDYVHEDPETYTSYGPDLATKKKLRRGDYKALNIYFVRKFGDENVIGWATFPNKTQKNTDQFYFDGVSILSLSLPGVPSSFTLPDGQVINGTGDGGILVHELGHWFGLLHTFDNFAGGPPCEGDGDFVDDTPHEIYTYPCEWRSDPTVTLEILDSCPNRPGIDNKGNYMTYIESSCMSHFTPGQIKRMWNWWNIYRGDNDAEPWYWPPSSK